MIHIQSKDCNFLTRLKTINLFGELVKILIAMLNGKFSFGIKNFRKNDFLILVLNDFGFKYFNFTSYNKN